MIIEPDLHDTMEGNYSIIEQPPAKMPPQTPPEPRRMRASKKVDNSTDALLLPDLHLFSKTLVDGGVV